VFSGLVFYPSDEAEQVLRCYRAACTAAPDELTTLVNLTTRTTGAVPARIGPRHVDH
jgi:hypothetical protein